MTVKELSKVLNVSERTIRKHAKEMGLTQNGIQTNIDEIEATEIKNRIERSGRRDLENVCQVSNVSTDFEMMGRVRDVVLWLNGKISQLTEENTTLKIELDQEKSWYSVKRVKSLGYLPDMKVHNIWRPLKQWSIENNYQIRSIFDANYGDVKTYHADVWKAVYNLDLIYREDK